MTDATTDGARMVAACTSGDEATVRETPSLARQVLEGPVAPLHYAALAERERCEVVTADTGLVNNLRPHFGFIVPLASLP